MMNPLDARAQKPDERTRTFSLLGGPLHRLGRRLGLVRGANSFPLGLALGLFAWSFLVVLALFEGVGQRIFSLALVGAHVRLLLVMPLFFLCEAWVDPRMTAFVGMIVRSGVIPEPALAALDDELARHERRKNSAIPEAVSLLAATLLPWVLPQWVLSGAASISGGDVLRATLTGQWYWAVSLTLFRFLLFRWVWRFGLWWYFLWRISRLELRLVPTHPDRAAGLGYLEVVHTHFIPLVVGLSAINAAHLAEQILGGAVPFEIIYPTLVVILVVDAVVFLGPLFVFAPKLWACWAKGLSDYGSFAARYVRGFDQKWLREALPAEEPLLGTPDLQSLSDLANSVDVVVNMKRVPASVRLLAELALAAVLPLLPLFLLKYPIAELARKLFARLFGL